MKYNINLIPVKETPWGERLVYFALHYLRYIIIITQLIVIGVFFYRFQIDQRIIDLREAVSQKKEIIQVVLPLLSQAEIIDSKINQARKITKEQNGFTQMINYLIANFPDSITLTKLEIENDQVKMSGFTNDSRQLQLFFNFLKKENKFKIVSFDTLKKSDNGYSFILVLNKFTF